MSILLSLFGVCGGGGGGGRVCTFLYDSQFSLQNLQVLSGSFRPQTYTPKVGDKNVYEPTTTVFRKCFQDLSKLKEHSYYGNVGVRWGG